MRFQTLGAAALVLSLSFVKCQPTKEEDETRPYEFGFNIEGYQHRHEKKDEKGIIMGEFGFVTGDGVYHITVYATDENGNFKILKMTNKFIGLPTDKPPISAPEDGVLMPIKVTEMMTNQLEGKKPEGIPGCGGCIIPIKKEPEMMMIKPELITGMEEMMKVKEPHHKPDKPATMSEDAVEPMKPIVNMEMMMHHIKPIMKPMMMHHGKPMMHHGKPMIVHEKPMEHFQALIKPMEPAPFMLTSPGADEEGIEPSTMNTPVSTEEMTIEDMEPAMTSSTPMEEMFSESPEEEGVMVNMDSMGSSGKKPSIPPAIVMQMINSMMEHGKEENRPKPPIKEPPQQMLSHDDLLGILYKYNYTLTHHGHHEIGKKNGEKTGAYFSNGRDGVGVNVKYKANEFGYQPNITFRKLSESETPKKETEKMLNKLHGYEFKWFYRR